MESEFQKLAMFTATYGKENTEEIKNIYSVCNLPTALVFFTVRRKESCNFRVK
jgi:hypothetical protein